MNKKVAGVLAVLTVTLALGTATLVVIQSSTARTAASSEAADRAKLANRIQDLHALEEAAEPTQPTTTTTLAVTTTRPVPTIVTIPPLKITAPPRVETPKNVPPDGALATCDVAQVQAGTTSSFQCRVQVGSQFQGYPSLMLICTASLTLCQMNPMIIEGIVPGGTYTSTATFSVDAQTAPTESMYLQITANSNSIGTFHFKLLAHPSYVLPISWQVACNPSSFVTTVGGPIQVTCNFHMENYRGSITLMMMTPEFLRTDAPRVIDVSTGDATITFNIFTAGMQPGQYSIPLIPFPGPDTPPGFVPSDQNVNAHIDLQLTGP